MNDSQKTHEQQQVDRDQLFVFSITRSEIRALREGFGDFYHFLKIHKKRVFVYGFLLPLFVGLQPLSANYQHWALTRMVDQSSIVLVEVDSAPYDLTKPWAPLDTLEGQGTGSIIHGQRILTAAHVVADAVKITVTRADQDESFEAEVVAVSHEVDLAVLTVRNDRFFEGATPLELQTLDHGNDELVAYGYPGDKLEYVTGWFAEAERGAYSLSRLENLKFRFEIPIRPGYSGGPVTWQGRIVGVTIEGDDEECEGLAVPTEVVTHFLEDIQDGHVDGSPVLVGSWQPTLSPLLRKHYGLTEYQTGVLVKQVLAGGLLRNDDVILAIDGYDLGNDGKIAVVPESQVSFEYLIDRKQLGDTLTVELLRDGRYMTMNVPLDQLSKDRMQIVQYVYDRAPSYLVVGGFVFSPLSKNYVFNFDDKSIEWSTRSHLIGLSRMLNTPGAFRNELIVLAGLLPDSSTVGYDDCLGHVVTSVDGRPVADMKDLMETLDARKGEHHRIQLEPGNKEVFLSAEITPDIQRAILEKFDIAEDHRND
jgi:S1-C subfamily serine protease